MTQFDISHLLSSLGTLVVNYIYYACYVVSHPNFNIQLCPHLARAGVIPLRIAPEKMLVFSKSLPYTSLEIGLKTIFHLWP